MDDDWVGKRLKDRYEILELLGVGGMSSVYKANDLNLGRVVALKVIHRHLSMSDDFMRRFRDEATAVAQLRHPNIVQVFDFDTTDNLAYIVFEFVPGENLRERMSRMADTGRVMNTEEVAAIGHQIAAALDYAHSRGLVHRDVKPANIMVDIHGDAFLADFGIVKIADDVTHTATGAVVGTARYMSPEQIRGGQLDGRTDIYSLGVTLFEMAKGQPPFEADSAMTLMMMHVNDPVPDMDAAGIAGPLGAVIAQALAKDPADRVQSGGEMAAALANPSAAAVRTRADRGPSTSPVPTPEPAAAVSTIRREQETSSPQPDSATSGQGNHRRSLAIGILIGVAAALIVGTLLTLVTNRGESSPNAGEVAAGSESGSENAATDRTSTTAASGPLLAASATDVVETAEIVDIRVESGTYVVDYETIGYTEELPGVHVHFYWNDIYEIQAGEGPAGRQWFVWGGPRPFDGYSVADRPAGATKMCVVVANPDHTIRTGTGNCFDLP